MTRKTRGQYEAEITREIIEMEKDFLGRGPTETRTFFVDDMILIRKRGILTPAETKLAETPEGEDLVKQTRRQLFESSRPLIDEIVDRVLECNVVGMHTDMDVGLNERILVLMVDMNLDEYFS
jgi:uncharacterized protein YbcI